MIVIHIGLKKAGSRSIQTFLRDNEEALRTSSVDFAQIGRQTQSLAHHNVAREIIAHLKKYKPKLGTIHQLARYWRAAPAATLVLSSELFEEANVEEIGVMRDKLAASRSAEKFRIVIVIRDLLDLMPSSYAQKTKFGTMTVDFDAFFEERMKARRVNYFETAKRWADAFGWHSLCIRLLDKDYLLNGDLLDDFMAICGIEPETAASLVRPGQLNISPGWKTLEAARALFGGRHGLPDDHPLAVAARPQPGKVLPQDERRALGILVMAAGDRRGWNEGKGRYLTREQAEWCREVYQAGIEALNRKLPRPFPLPPDLESQGFVPREFLPDVTCIPADELTSLYEEIERRRVRKTRH